MSYYQIWKNGRDWFLAHFFSHDVIQRLKYVSNNTDAVITDITSFFKVLKPVLSPTNQSFFRPKKSCDIIKKI